MPLQVIVILKKSLSKLLLLDERNKFIKIL
jgi:hypothetical protein